MIPVKLSLRNFLSYRENVPALDFTGLHVACLCGDNGHGKSALLDAITWCLWGQARGQVQDDLVSYGADEARVALEFTARDGRFRVVRIRRRSGGRRRQGASDLQLISLTDEGAVEQVVSGNSIRETQARIVQLAGMDYETFINSAFLMQGRADEFTSKSPAERKAVLSSVLGLEAYDRFQARSRERVVEKRSESDRLSGRVRQIQSEKESLGNPDSELVSANLQVEGIADQLARSRKEAGDLKVKVAELNSLQAALTERKTRKAELASEIDRLQAYVESAQVRVKEHEAIIARAGDIEVGSERLVGAQQEFAHLEGARLCHDNLKEEEHELGRAIDVERTNLEADARQLRVRITRDLAPLAESETALEQFLENARDKLKVLSGQENDLLEARKKVQLVATGIGEAQTLAARYESDAEQIKEKLRLLEVVDPRGVVCPLCMSPLSEDGCLRLAQNYEAEIEEKRNLYRVNRNTLRTLESQKKELELDLAEREREHNAVAKGLQEEIGRTEAQLKAAKSAATELNAARIRLDELANSLQNLTYAREAQCRLSAVRGQLEELGYDDSAYTDALRRMRELEPFGQLKLRLETAREQLPGEKQVQAQNREQAERLSKELESLGQQVADGERSAAQLPAERARLEEVEREVSTLEGGLQSALSRKALLEDRVQRLAILEQELVRSAEAQARALEDQGIYQELVSAFGRQGIQAMLIETVVPRLEEETNVLLGRMTDNRMHVKLETQRERRSGSGEPIETLEINVSDELGARSYEMYSGGEAFRVNLALRIALSRVLSQRTGAPLPTLFIDEGFGSQDASGRERILDVISAIEDDFDKIIVITHLDDLKDMFPVRIEVQKDENGSTFWLS